MKTKTKNKSISLVLGGGGARGFFHLGIIKALKELNIEIKEIAGTSIGALIGLIYANNPDINPDELIEQIHFMRLFDISFSRTSFMSTSYITELIRHFVKVDNFSELKIPFCFNACDIDTGKEVVFNKGKIFPGVLATMAIPGVFPLVKLNGFVLCDGGIVNNIPVNLVEGKNILACDVNLLINQVNQKSGEKTIVGNTIVIMQTVITDFYLKNAKKEKNVFCLKLMDNTGIFDFRKSTAKRLLQQGYEETMKHKKAILKLAQ